MGLCTGSGHDAVLDLDLLRYLFVPLFFDESPFLQTQPGVEQLRGQLLSARHARAGLGPVVAVVVPVA